VLWKDRNFDDSSWLSGEGAFGYDTNARYQPATQLSDMNGSDSAVFFRADFNLTAVPPALLLGTLVDDGFVAYLNGVEVARDNMLDPVTWTSLAANSVNPSWNATLDITSPTNYNPNPALHWIDISAFAGAWFPGSTTLAVEAHNVKVTNADFLFLAELDAANLRATVTGLSPSRTYYFAMRATDGAGNRSASSAVVSAKPILAPPPVPVQG